jgi:hypothetical protein
MDKKNDVINLASAAIFHADQAFLIIEELGHLGRAAVDEAYYLHKAKYRQFAEQISEDITHLRRIGEL